jgi:hypothetical protein
MEFTTRQLCSGALIRLTVADGGGGIGHADVGEFLPGLLRSLLHLVLQPEPSLLGRPLRHGERGGGNGQHGRRGSGDHSTPVHNLGVRARRAPHWPHLQTPQKSHNPSYPQPISKYPQPTRPTTSKCNHSRTERYPQWENYPNVVIATS